MGTLGIQNRDPIRQFMKFKRKQVPKIEFVKNVTQK